ncbi:hypothetical protein SBDP1_1130018 [Syntrophobacter sp. SbD1]|nr:hypothetical protein SBDP1_1130018 [Syntrophobacter sp. SbD1]
MKDDLMACNVKSRLLREWNRTGKLIDIMDRLTLLSDHVMMQCGLRLVSANLVYWIDPSYQSSGMFWSNIFTLEDNSR